MANKTAHPLQSLQGDLARITDLLDQGRFFSLKPELERSIRTEVDRLSRKLSLLEESQLTIGLLGGTGVGKSSLMNALAGEKIASVSHRRPHTDQVLIYKHAEAGPLSAPSLGEATWKEITHHSNAIRQIILCDLPDFDSLMGKHREEVLQFLEHLDLLVWITSPEKYADARFYEFLKAVPKAKQNFSFVLNKVDLVFQGKNPHMGYEEMNLIFRRFRELIRENGIEDPLLYMISAQETIGTDETAPWNQFISLRRHIFQQRDLKQIAALKAANLDVEVRTLLEAFEGEALVLERFEDFLGDAAKELQDQRNRLVQAGHEAVGIWLGDRIRQEILFRRGDPIQLIGPGYGFALLFQAFGSRFSPNQDSGADLTVLRPPEEIKLSFRRHLEGVEDRISHHILRRNLPAPFLERLRQVVGVEKRFEDLGERFLQALLLHLVDPPAPALWGFRALQWFTYLLLLALLLFAVGSQNTWEAVLAEPGAVNFLQLLLSIIHTLFSTKGLAALCTYGLINLFVGFVFYRRYRKRLLRVADKRIKALKAALLQSWEQSLDNILKDLEGWRADLRTRRSELTSLLQR
ncbi:MAG: 50S ribosome-binding GTPase [Proteobacteria bacterium]|nr:50S ribosome-binding GTPase [Pseudomonadota bacterium]